MKQDFWSHLSDSFTKAVPYGATAYLKQQDLDEKLAEKQQKLAVKNQQTRDYAKMTGQEVEFDQYGQAKIKTPDGWKFVEPVPADIAQYFPTIGNEYQQAFTELQKTNKPDYVGTPQYVYNDESGQYDIKQLNRKNNQMETLGTVSPNDFKRVKFDQTIRGEVEIDGVKFGKKGRDTRIKVYEHKDKEGNPYVEQLDLGITKTGKGAKTLDEVDWLAKMSDIDERLNNIKVKQNQYLYGKFPPKDESGYDARELVRQSINADLNEIATQYMKMGSPVAKNVMMEIFKEGKDLTKSNNATIGVGAIPLTRTQYYQQKREEITQEWVAGGLGDRDAEVILAFLDAKFNQWIPSQDTKRNDDEVDLDSILNEINNEEEK